MIFGKGENDLNGASSTKCYVVWHSMLRRCYSEVYHGNKKSYKECVVDEKWLKLSEFKKWFDENYIEGFELEKDLCFRGNKVYSENTCCFVPREINTLLISCTKASSGVTFNKRLGKWVAQFSTSKDGKRVGKHIGVFLNKQEAVEAYNREKSGHVQDILLKYDHCLSEKTKLWISSYFK